MFDHNIVREVLYGVALIVALGSGPWPQPYTGWQYARWALCVLILIVLFLMLVH